MFMKGDGKLCCTALYNMYLTLIKVFYITTLINERLTFIQKLDILN